MGTQRGGEASASRAASSPGRQRLLAGSALSGPPATAGVVEGAAPESSLCLVDDGATPSASGSRRRLRALAVTTVTLVYVAIGLAAFWPVLPGSTTRLFGQGPDSVLGAWSVSWVAHAVVHGQNPFFTRDILAPSGVNLAQNNIMPLLGVLTLPLTLTAGPVASVNLLMVLAMPASAAAAFAVFLRLRVWLPAAAVGGLIYGFSPYMVGHGLGHVMLVFAVVPPLIALALISILGSQRRSLRRGVVLGLLVTAQFFVEPEVLATVGIAVGVALAWSFICWRAWYRGRVGVIAWTLGVAALVAGILLAYPVWMMVAGPQHYVGPAQGIPNPYFNHLLSFVVPGILQKQTFGMGALGAALSAPDAAELGGYIGIPVLVVAAVFGFCLRRTRRMQLALVVMVAMGLLSLGPHLAVGTNVSSVPLPAWVMTKLPLLDNILPSRLSFEVDACLAAVVAFGLDDVRSGRVSWASAGWRSDRRGSVVLVVVVVAALVATQLPQWPYASQVVPGPLTNQVRRSIPPGDPVAITYPYSGPLSPVSDWPMLWQAEDGFDFRLASGYAIHRGPTGRSAFWPGTMNPPGLQQFLAAGTPPSAYGPAPRLGASLVAGTRRVLREYDVRVVIVGRAVKGSEAVGKLFRMALGPPRVATRSFFVWVSPKRAL